MTLQILCSRESLAQPAGDHIPIRSSLPMPGWAVPLCEVHCELEPPKHINHSSGSSKKVSLAQPTMRKRPGVEFSLLLLLSV